jgi:hypothetical protein
LDQYLVAAAFSTGIKLAAGAMMLFFAQRKHRKAALYWGVGWVFYAYAIGGDITRNFLITAASIGVFSSFLLLGVLKLPGGGVPSSKALEWFSLTPLIISVYIALITVLGNGEGTIPAAGAAYGIAGVFVFVAGLMFYEMREVYGSKARNTGLSLLIYGLHQMDYPFMRPVQWFVPIGFWIGFILTLLTAFFMVEFSTGETFEISASPKKQIRIEPGVRILRPNEIEKFLEELRDYPTLAFVRNVEVPEGWRTFRITNLDGSRNVSPTNLPRILETAVEYLSSTRERGDITPVVFLEGLEYLKLYNDFPSIAKFISTLRDYVNLKNGTLVLITDKNTWDEREWRLLNRLLS